MFAAFAQATPSSTYFTNCTLDIQTYKVWHITYDSYFTLGKKGDEKGDFATDVGLTVGILPFEKFQMEVGFDWLEPTDDPFFFNVKVGSPENTLCGNCPAIQVGIFNVGTEKDVTDYNVAQLICREVFAWKAQGDSLPADMSVLIHCALRTVLLKRAGLWSRTTKDFILWKMQRVNLTGLSS